MIYLIFSLVPNIAYCFIRAQVHRCAHVTT